jgi:hypothetical protein
MSKDAGNESGAEVAVPEGVALLIVRATVNSPVQEEQRSFAAYRRRYLGVEPTVEGGEVHRASDRSA